MDLNSDGEVTKEEFLKFCQKDEAMAKLFDKKGEGGHALFFGLWLQIVPIIFFPKSHYFVLDYKNSEINHLKALICVYYVSGRTGL